MPVAGDYLVVARGPPRRRPARGVRWRPRPSVWVRRTGGVVGLVSLGPTARRSGCSPCSASAWQGARRGLGRSSSGLAGVDAGMRQASLALRTPRRRPELAAFDDRLPEALLLTSPEVAGRLVAVWLGPLLALPPADRAPLLETLHAWVATGGSTTHTAARVHCHRNTVINRLRAGRARSPVRTGSTLRRLVTPGVPRPPSLGGCAACATPAADPVTGTAHPADGQPGVHSAQTRRARESWAPAGMARGQVTAVTLGAGGSTTSRATPGADALEVDA